jgi:hypothetical protein
MKLILAPYFAYFNLNIIQTKFEGKKLYNRNGLVFLNSGPGEVISNSSRVRYFLERMRH